MFYIMGSEMRWKVYTDPPQYSRGGPLNLKGYHARVPAVCYDGPMISLKLNRLKREFEVVSERKY